MSKSFGLDDAMINPETVEKIGMTLFSRAPDAGISIDDAVVNLYRVQVNVCERMHFGNHLCDDAGTLPVGDAFAFVDRNKSGESAQHSRVERARSDLALKSGFAACGTEVEIF
jgi:hypothetical protein